MGVIGSIYTGSRFMPVTASYMAAGSLCIGSTNNSYGGNTGTSNIAGFILETQNGGNQEIAIHDYGATVKSFMCYIGAEQRIYLGRDMGNGWGACPIAVRSNFQTRVVSSASANYITFYNQGGNTTSYIGCENSSGAGLFGSGQAYGMSLGCVNNSGVSLFQNNSLLTQWFRNSFSEVVQTIPAGSSYTFNIGSGYAFTITPSSVETNKYMRVSNGGQSTCLYGPNGYNSYLLVGAGLGSAEVNSLTACVKSTNGNLHLDCAVGYSTYINYYTVMYAGTSTLVYGSFSNPSDARFKENIITADNELCYNNIKKIRIVRYNFIKDSILHRCTGNDKNQLGVLAQELQTVFPNSVTESNDPETKEPFKAVDTRQMYFTLVGCTQQLQLLIEQQQKQIEEQKAQIASYENRFKHYDELLDSMDQKFKRLGLKIQF